VDLFVPAIVVHQLRPGRQQGRYWMLVQNFRERARANIEHEQKDCCWMSLALLHGL
jgi:hypothetical protein